MKHETLKRNLESHGINFRYFDTKEQAAQYLNGEIDQTNVVFGGSMTLKEMGLYDSLKAHNDVFWHWEDKDRSQRQAEIDAKVYLSSANAIAETGEIVNIDGSCNRVANAIYGPETTYYVCGENKLTANLQAAIDRAREIASPLNTARLNLKTPCVQDGKCHDCTGPNRICNVMTIVMGKPGRMKKCEVVLIGEKCGY